MDFYNKIITGTIYNKIYYTYNDIILSVRFAGFLNIDNHFLLDVYFLPIVTRVMHMMTLFSKTFAGFSNH